MEHKALKYQMKNMISNFPDEILKPILLQLENGFRASFKINILLKSYKWYWIKNHLSIVILSINSYEAGLMFKEKKITGFI